MTELGNGVVLDVRGEHAVVSLDRPEKRNALSWALVDDLARALTDAEHAGCTVVVLASSGGSGTPFCAGGDLDEAQAGRSVPVDSVVAALRTTPLFVIARVEGDVYGAGLALLGACPVVLCTRNVRLTMPAARTMDIFPTGFFGRLGPRLAPRSLVELGLRSTPCTADRAAALGWITAVVEPSDIDAEVERWVADSVARPGATRAARAFWRSEVDGNG